MDKLTNEVKKLMKIWLYDFPYNIEPTITDIKTCHFDGKIVVFIECHRPGLIIGKEGININNLKEILERNLNKEVFISLKESELWNIDYNINYK